MGDFLIGMSGITGEVDESGEDEEETKEEFWDFFGWVRVEQSHWVWVSGCCDWFVTIGMGFITD